MNLKIVASIIALGFIAFAIDYARPVQKIEEVIPIQAATGATIPWGDLSARLIETGVVDETKFPEIRNLKGQVIVTPENNRYVLNALWAFGLANKNPVLTEGPINNVKGGAENLASTGGWTIAKGAPMSHFAMHEFVALTSAQQMLVENISRNIFRPCCGNSTYMPDCNHGMAMLGLLELMAASGANEDEMYDQALVMNRLWFPGQYERIDEYFAEGYAGTDVPNTRTLLSAKYSSAQGMQTVLSRIAPKPTTSGSGCGV
ncbi:MAG: hypothetical protein AAB590_00615 [Patescibacteria group bacterium]